MLLHAYNAFCLLYSQRLLFFLDTLLSMAILIGTERYGSGIEIPLFRGLFRRSRDKRFLFPRISPESRLKTPYKKASKVYLGRRMSVAMAG